MILPAIADLGGGCSSTNSNVPDPQFPQIRTSGSVAVGQKLRCSILVLFRHMTLSEENSPCSVGDSDQGVEW